ncbi:hypothetical protein niasHT_037320 [Heterodera trifolii]|uniref:Uncharacterized protein n=1 Tax=Heterodera trifolii TaxID=157864 RepID=A0ABD2J0E1_9BILA
MELLLFRHDEFDKLYGCEGFNADKIPLEERTNIVNGGILITLFFVFELLYIPCMVSIYKNMDDNACYKLMFFYGILEMLILFINALETGILGIIGAVYCDYPLLIYITGTLGIFLWVVEKSVEMLLAINRCMELLRPQLANAIFSGKKLRCLFALPICYGILAVMFTETPLFSAVYLSWFFNPYVGYTDDFGKITFLQVVIISLFNSIASVIYVSMQFVRIGKIYIIVGTYAWLFTSGCPPVVYLLLNKRIRNDCASFGRAILRFLRNGNNNSVTNGPIAMAWMTPNYARNNANNISNNNNHVPQQ